MNIKELLSKMVDIGSSDLIMTVGAPPQFRMQGFLESYGTTPLGPDDTLFLANEILSRQQMQELDQEKAVDLSQRFEGIGKFRINIFFQRGAIALAIRLINVNIPSFSELGVPEIAREFASKPHGLVLLTGACGSGKSTTMAGMLEHINETRCMHVVTIEDPIEFEFTNNNSIFNQREIGYDAHTFAGALRSVFRQSPDVIMVGEIRDTETMSLVLQLASTGHLIFSTLHTQDTIRAVSRMAGMFPSDQQQQIFSQISMTLNGIIAQQLLPRISGGRALAYEVLVANNAIRNLIREGQTQQIYSVIQTGRKEGMVCMNDTLADLTILGEVEENEALSRSPRPKEFLQILENRRALENRR